MNYRSCNDETLLGLLKADDRLAFEEIYNRYVKKLLKIGNTKLSDPVKIEDCVQEIFLSLWEKRTTARIQRLDAYLITSLKYKIIDVYRSRIIFEDYPLNLGEKNFMQEAEMHLTVEDINEIIFTQLDKLPAKTVQIFNLSRFKFKSTKEISKELGIPERTIEYHITKALNHLRFHLRDYVSITFIGTLFSL